MRFPIWSWQKIFGLVLTAALSFISVPGFATTDRDSSTPPDLLLDRNKVAESKALAHYAWGLFLLLQEQKRTEEVQYHLLEALRNNPDSQHLLEQAATTWLVKEDYDSLLENLAPIALDKPEAVLLQLLVSTTYRKNEQIDDAIKIIENAFLENEIHDPRLMRELAQLYWNNKDYEKLGLLLDRVRQMEDLKGKFLTYYALAVFHGSMADEPDGAQLSEKQITRHKTLALYFARQATEMIDSADSPADIIKLASIFEAQKRFQSAIELLQGPRKQYPDFKPLFDIHIAQNLHSQGNTEHAVDLLYSIDIKKLSDPQLLMRLGRAFVEQEQVKGAIHCYERILKMAPRAESLRLTLAYLYLRNDSPQAAIKLITEQDINTPETLMLFSRAHYQMKDLTEAQTWLERAAKQAETAETPDFFGIEYYLYKATLQEESGDTDAAIKSAREAHGQAPENPVVCNFLGYVLADHNRKLEEAESLIRLAVSKQPENAAFLDSLAWVYYRQEKYNEALTEINKALRQPDQPADPTILDHAGDIYIANGYGITAARYWWEALRQDPRHAAEIERKLNEQTKSFDN